MREGQPFARLADMTEATTFAEVIETVREQSAHLLGTTISYGEHDWAEATPLPGWTRSHIAAHVIDNALAISGAIDRLADGPTSLRGQHEHTEMNVELRALRSGVDLQIELDETAGALQQVLPRVEQVVSQVAITGGWSIPAHQLPILRLREVMIHHYDLIGTDAFELPKRIWLELLAFEIERPSHASLPPLLVVSDEGFSCMLGTGEEATTIMGPARDLFAWLARRVPSTNLSGVDTLA